MLSEEKKQKLLSLIDQAEANGESPEFIQNELIPAFKQKHDTPEVQQEKGLIQRGLEFAGKTITGAVQHPIETVKGLGYGAAKSIAGMATDFAANVNPEDNEDINMTMPGRFPVREASGESSKDIIQRREGLAEQAVTPITENLTPQESRAAKIGELLVPASAAEIALGGPIGTVAGKAVKGVVKGAAKITGDALVNLDNVAGRIAEGSTKVSEEALRMSGTKSGREALKAAANKQFEIGKELVDMIDNADEFIPERAIVENALNDMPDINMKPVLNAIEKAKVYEASPTAIAANKRLDGLKDIYLKLSKQNIDVPIMQKGATGTEPGLQVYNPNALATDAAQQVGTAKATVDVPLKATDFREVRRQLDNEIKSAFDKDPGEATEFEKQARRIRLVMKNELIKAAEKSGNKEYVDAMKTWSDKIDKVDAIKSFLGKNATTRANRVESFVANLFNKNKTQQQKTLQDISQVFGKDFVEKSRLTYLANQLGDEGTASWLPQWTTGRGKVDKVTGLVFGSPKVASRVTLPVSGKIGEVGKKLKSFGEKSSLKDIRTK